MDDDGDETPERRKEMLALRQAGYGDRVAVSLGNVPTGPVKDYSFRGRNALRKPAGIKSGSRPVKSANELWASHKDEPGKNSRDRTPNGSIRNSNGALGALGAGGFNTGGSPRSSNGGSREGSTRPRNISFNDAPSEVLRPEVAVHIGGSGGGEKSDANKDGASTSASTNQTPHGSPFKAPGELSPARKMVSMLNGDDVWSGGSPTGSPRRSLDGVEEETERGAGHDSNRRGIRRWMIQIRRWMIQVMRRRDRILRSYPACGSEGTAPTGPSWATSRRRRGRCSRWVGPKARAMGVIIAPR